MDMTQGEDKDKNMDIDAAQHEAKAKASAKHQPKNHLNDKRPYITLVAEVGVKPEDKIKTPAVHVLQQPLKSHHPDVWLYRRVQSCRCGQMCLPPGCMRLLCGTS